MATKPATPCGFPRCPQFRPCPVHSQRRQPGNYRADSPGHHRLRIECFERDGWKCRRCGWEPDVVITYRRFGIGKPPASEVLAELKRRYNSRERHLQADHIVPVDVRQYLELELSNMQTLCDRCHRQKTNQENIGAY